MLLEDCPILYYTIRQFLTAPSVSRIILVVPTEYIGTDIVNACLPRNSHKSIQILPGGSKRQDSVKNGLSAVSGRSEIVIVHDGVRPFVTTEEIDKTVQMCEMYDGVILAVPAVDTLKEVQDSVIVRTIDRSQIWQAQTPQTFRKEILLRAYRKAIEDNFTGTDEASLVERIGGRVGILSGTGENVKITCENDIEIAKSILKNRTR